MESLRVSLVFCEFSSFVQNLLVVNVLVNHLNYEPKPKRITQKLHGDKLVPCDQSHVHHVCFDCKFLISESTIFKVNQSLHLVILTIFVTILVISDHIDDISIGIKYQYHAIFQIKLVTATKAMD